jgi:hypothetical protein
VSVPLQDHVPSVVSGSELPYRYGVYGIRVLSDRPLDLPDYSDDDLGCVQCVTARGSSFADVLKGATFRSRPGSWYRYASLLDGSSYVRWDNVGEFLVSADGRRVVCRREEKVSSESFQVYLLGQALSFALVKQHLEPLHATTVVVDGKAVAFLGSNAFGKSSLAASFLAAGFRLLTDDLLIVRDVPHGAMACPGPPRIKLFSKVAGRVLGGTADGPAMHTETDKRVLRLATHQSCSEPVMLKTIYAVAAPRDACRTPEVRIETLSPRDAFVALLKGTFNRRLVSAERLERQFGAMAALADRVVVKTLAYPRAIDRLTEVRAAVLADLERG